VTYPLGKRPSNGAFAAVALGDVNADAKLNLVILDSEAYAVNVLLGAGDGTFGLAAAFPTAITPSGLALGDVNGDGWLDIATANSANHTGTGPGTASVLLGDGHGTFAAHVDYPTGVATRAVALGDLDDDGKLDLVVANTGVDDYWSVGVLRGNGDGTFAEEVEFESGFGPNSVALGDLNGDHKLDVVTANAGIGGTVSVLLGNGDGTLAAHVDYPAGGGAGAVALADVNGDHLLDVVAGSNGVMVLLGKGDGTFATALTYAPTSSSMSLGDLNGDGRPDVVIASYPASVGVLLNTCR
jgi:hypothetical protein